MREVIQCLIDWLDQVPSDQKAHSILRALAEESLKKADFDEEQRKFTKKEIVAATNELIDDHKVSKWMDWKNTVLPYWESRKKDVIQLAREKNLDSFPMITCDKSGGGRGIETKYWIKSELLPEIIKENTVLEKDNNKTHIDYEIAERREIKLIWFLNFFLKDGQLKLSKWSIWIIIGWMIIVGASVVLLSYFSWMTLSIPQPVTTREISLFINVFILPYIVWIWVIKPWVYLFDDRIIPAFDLCTAIKEKPAQLELFKDGEQRFIRLVRYTAPCLICGATVYLDKGEPDYPRRLVGRCSESPREHVFSFDRVTRKGNVLKSPYLN